MADAQDFTDQYNTQLSPDQEAQFRAQFPDPKDLYDYDLRGAFASGATKAANGHLPDAFKKPNHPTFSVESKYSRGPMMGGKWTSLPSGKEAFVASPINLTHHTPEALQQYFGRVEPNIQLVLPNSGAPTAGIPLNDPMFSR